MASDIFFDLLEKSLQGAITGYAIVYKSKDEIMRTIISEPNESNSIFEQVGMVEFLKEDILNSTRQNDGQEEAGA